MQDRNTKTGRPWRLTAPAPLDKVEVSAEDSVKTRLDVPPVLPPGRVADILAGELRRRHFEDSEGGKLARERGGVRVEINPDTGEVGVSVEETQSRDVPKPPPDNPSPCGCRGAAALQEALAEHKARAERDAQKALQQEVTDRLERALPKIACELEGVAAKVTREALKEKARSMGEVKEESEDARTGALTIVVEV